MFDGDIDIPDAFLLDMVHDVESGFTKRKYQEFLVKLGLYRIAEFHENEEMSGYSKHDLIVVTLQGRGRSRIIEALYEQRILSTETREALDRYVSDPDGEPAASEAAVNPIQTPNVQDAEQAPTFQTSALSPEERRVPESLPAALAGERAGFAGQMGQGSPGEAEAPGWDVFISYASEDRDAVATPLAEALRASGLRVWYDQYEIHLGDSLFRSISRGLRDSRFGIVILSRAFLAKRWPERELSGLFSLMLQPDQDRRILPIWYNIDAADVVRFSPLMVDLVAARWSEGLDAVVRQLLQVTSAGSDDRPDQPSFVIRARLEEVLPVANGDAQIALLVAEYPRPLVVTALREIVMDRNQNAAPRIRALVHLLSLDTVEPALWDSLLAEPNGTLVARMIRLLATTDVILTQDQLHRLFAGGVLPAQTAGLGKMITHFISIGAPYTSGVFAPLANCPVWQVKYDSVKSIIQLDDSDSIPTLALFASTSYFQVRRRIAVYLQMRHAERRLSAEERQITTEMLTRMLRDGKTEPGTPTERHIKEALEVISSSRTVEWIHIPVGRFSMGCDPAQQPGCDALEGPPHQVHLSDFEISRTPVTNAQYATFLEATGGMPPSHWPGGKVPAGLESHPVVNVSWYEADAFCKWLSAVEGRPCRLPTEAEWEKAARGPDGRVYPWGNEFGVGNCNSRESGIGTTTCVGDYSPTGDSLWRVADMAGNVWEWTGSLWGPDERRPAFGYPYQSQDGREDERAGSLIRRVLRGGAYDNESRDVRCTHRISNLPRARGPVMGFRVVSELAHK